MNNELFTEKSSEGLFLYGFLNELKQHKLQVQISIFNKQLFMQADMLPDIKLNVTLQTREEIEGINENYLINIVAEPHSHSLLATIHIRTRVSIRKDGN